MAGWAVKNGKRMARYYYLNNRMEKVGPFSRDELTRQGLRPDTRVWEEESDTWRLMYEIRRPQTPVKGGTAPSLVKVLLVSYAVTGAIVGLLAGRFAAAFAASWFGVKPLLPAIIVLIVAALPVAVTFFSPGRKGFVYALLAATPFLASSLFTTGYYLANPTTSYKEGYCFIEKGSGRGTLDRFGRESIPCRYDEILPWFAPGILRVERDGLRGLYSTSGEEILPCEYIMGVTRNFTGNERWENIGPVFINQGGTLDEERNVSGGKWGIIDGRDGQILLPCIYESVWGNNKCLIGEYGVREGGEYRWCYDLYEFDDNDNFVRKGRSEWNHF